jgi:release factor glutamine methyltransferase
VAVLLADAVRALEAAGIVFARREAEWLLESASGLPRARAVATGVDLDADEARRFAELVARRVSGEPLQYVTGLAGFRRLELSVGPGVFIPRPETEVVADRAMQRLPRRGTVVDVGTGSGAIALSIADERPNARVWATEASPDAFRWAEKNRDALGLKVELVLGDLFDGLPPELAGDVDVVVANPPYVPEKDRAFLPIDVVGHEPPGALFGSDDGLSVIRRIVVGARAWLKRRGWVVLEVGDRQGAAVAALLTTAGYRDTAVHRDLTGRERIVEARV